MSKITPGKRNGLQNIANKNGFFIIAALDHRNSLKKLIDPMQPEKVPSSIMQTIKTDFTKTLAQNVSAILLDPEYGMNASIKANRDGAGLLMSLEESSFIEKNHRRYTELLSDWDVKRYKEMNVDAVKLLVYYRPEDESSERQLKLTHRVAEMCKKHDIAFVCEPFVYALKDEKDFTSNFPTFVVQTAKDFSKLDIDVLKVQFPGNSKVQNTEDMKDSCEDLDAVCRMPWVLLSGGEKYDELLKQVHIANKFNVSGVMVGRALWQEAFEKKSLQEIVHFVKTESVARLNKLSVAVQSGMPWFERV